MTYKCICGQEFDNPQKFNRHKAFCRTHIESKGLDYNQYISDISEKHRQAALKQAQLQKETLERRRQHEFEIWLSEQHTCERCGKIMTEKFGSGRFCSRACANTRNHSEEVKTKIGNSIKDLPTSFSNKSFSNPICRRAHEKAVANYELNPKHCMICGCVLPYEIRDRKTCSLQCAKVTQGGTRVGQHYRYKYGYYNGIRCDSSYELAFLVYCIHHDIPIKRNTEYFQYFVDNELHTYSPDFKINNVYIEIKGYDSKKVQIKANAIKSKNLQYQLLFGKDIQPCIDYCIEKYGKKYWEVLYDKDKPSCNNKINNNGIS